MGKPTFQGGKLETLCKNQSERKGKVHKRYEKRSHIKKMKKLTKEGVVSFWRLEKAIIGKAGTFLTKDSVISFWRLSLKSYQG